MIVTLRPLSQFNPSISRFVCCCLVTAVESEDKSAPLGEAREREEEEGSGGCLDAS